MWEYHVLLELFLSVEGSPIVPFLVVGKDCFIAGGAETPHRGSALGS